MKTETTFWRMELVDLAAKKLWDKIKSLGIFYKNAMMKYKPDSFGFKEFEERYLYAKGLYAQRVK
jgi:hypothetical protein